MIIEKKILKFVSINYINVSLCEKYSDILSDLTPIEEAFIAYAHLVISIIKLRLDLVLPLCTIWFKVIL